LRHEGGWIGVDLDGTLAEYTGYQGPGHIGAPIPAMVTRVKDWLRAHKDVRIFTARASNENDDEREAFLTQWKWWSKQHLGQVLKVTATKDYQMCELWDDRAIQVRFNTGERVGEANVPTWKKDWSAHVEA
jgi:hypothetical protein